MNNRSSRPLRFWTRAVWAAIGLSLFIWIGFEDSSTVTVLLLASLLTFAIAISLVGRSRTLNKSISAPPRGLRHVLAGMLVGGAVGPSAVLLMVIKNGLHGHYPADFSAQQVLGVALRTPVWALAGGLLGLAWWLTMREFDPRNLR